MKALLYSGGIDSTLLLHALSPDIAITIRYGQLAQDAEVKAAKHFASSLNIAHETIDVDFSKFGRGVMVGRKIGTEKIFEEFWPFRNQMLATVAGMHLFENSEVEILFGTLSHDGKFLDGTKEFYGNLSNLFEIQEGNIKISAPFLEKSIDCIIKKYKISPFILPACHSCHVAGVPCGECNGCRKNSEVLGRLLR